MWKEDVMYPKDTNSWGHFCLFSYATWTKKRKERKLRWKVKEKVGYKERVDYKMQVIVKCKWLQTSRKQIQVAFLGVSPGPVTLTSLPSHPDGSSRKSGWPVPGRKAGVELRDRTWNPSAASELPRILEFWRLLGQPHVWVPQFLQQHRESLRPHRFCCEN